MVLVSYPEGGIEGGISAWCLEGGQDPQGSGRSNRLGPVVDAEFAVDIAVVDLDRMQREEKPGRDFRIG